MAYAVGQSAAHIARARSSTNAVWVPLRGRFEGTMGRAGEFTRVDTVGRRTSLRRPLLSAEVGQEEPTGHRPAAVGFGPQFNARQTGETLGHVAIEARGSDVLDNPVLRHHLT